MVEADLPFGCFVASEMLTSKIEDRLFRNSDQQDIIDDECCPKRRKVKLEGGQQDAALIRLPWPFEITAILRRKPKWLSRDCSVCRAKMQGVARKRFGKHGERFVVAKLVTRCTSTSLIIELSAMGAMVMSDGRKWRLLHCHHLVDHHHPQCYY